VEGFPAGEEFALSPGEQGRLSAMRFALRRKSFLFGRLAAKQLLALHPVCAGRQPAEITIANRPEGAPYAMIDGIELPGCLSLSHRDDSAVCALVCEPGVAVGIDLEVVEGRSAAFVEDFFTREESRFIFSLPEGERAAWVTCIWSAKEAVLKALGVGLRVDSRTVSICPAADPAQMDGWQALVAGGPALAGAACRLWWRPCGSRVVTLAALFEKDAQPKWEPFILQPVPVSAARPAIFKKIEMSQ
jgi:4'-phosphopantetheinyl transferase